MARVVGNVLGPRRAVPEQSNQVAEFGVEAVCLVIVDNDMGGAVRVVGEPDRPIEVTLAQDLNHPIVARLGKGHEPLTHCLEKPCHAWSAGGIQRHRRLDPGPEGDGLPPFRNRERGFLPGRRCRT